MMSAGNGSILFFSCGCAFDFQDHKESEMNKMTMAVSAAMAFAAVLLLSNMAKAEMAEFPPTPKDVTLVDRALFSWSDSEPRTYFYAIFFNARANSVIRIFKAVETDDGLAWGKPFDWEPTTDGIKVAYSTLDVLEIYALDKDRVAFQISEFAGAMKDYSPTILIYDRKDDSYK
jgi:hypothetical protein